MPKEISSGGERMSFDDRLTPMERRYDKLLDEFRELKKENQQQIEEFLADLKVPIDTLECIEKLRESEHDELLNELREQREKWEKRNKS
jgi:hypothetical protein